MSFTSRSSAIIIRHDRSYSDYQARERDFPAVFYLERQARRKVCVATVVAPGWAITAAHCASETALQDTLESGSYFPVSVAGRERHIDLLVIHPAYRPGAPDEVDLALLRFSTPLELPRPIPLHTGPDEAGRVVTLLGWGFFGIGTTGRQYDDGRFRMARNLIESAEQRLVIHFDDPREAGTQALDLEGMPGLGDSGGPALLAGANGGSLVGVAVGEVMGEDFSEETQGRYGSVAVYERISSHLDWIRQTMSAHAGEESE
jgi:secreted trypsin-like serine protease